MIDLYTWTTPNGRKISIMLEETGLPYKVVPVNLGALEQQRPEFLALNPNGKIPAIVDHDAPGGPLTIFESGAILVYLAEKTKRFLPTEVRAHAATMQWLMFQMSQVGPMIGQVGHFVNQAPEKIPYAIQRFVGESVRIIDVLQTALEGRDHLAGEYSIADIATYPWIVAAWQPFANMMPEKITQLGNVQRWLDRVAARPAVQRGMAVPAA
ncbi:MAG TPA: glutathione S-transferase N-terminal domain-containing protein [Candidatus Eisenbacteria bacterium]|nr:glutathione S-transferase N-terminal domain-containing protein [Candidatus Eisenbacteria bacterium]